MQKSYFVSSAVINTLEMIFMTLQDVINKFNTTPFLFAGSGITRRYYNLPDWEGLLQHFAKRLSNDRFSYNQYLNKAKSELCPLGVLPRVASLLQIAFDEVWFANPNMRTLDEGGMRQVEEGVSPFKAEVAAYIKSKSVPEDAYANELLRLRNISKNNISGIITTNYDLFFETQFENYKTYVGQDQLVFSAIQGIAEIYKIHGSVTQPESLVINEEDYQKFNKKSQYLSAKLMTIFMEYPIIFIGYSLNDLNIRRILANIVECLPREKMALLQERFIFVEWKQGYRDYTIEPHSIDLEGNILTVTKVVLDDFGMLYDALAAKKAAVPIKLLRRFKEEIYTYAITSKPGPLLQVAALDDAKIDEDNLAICIGLRQGGEYGLVSAVDGNIWYRNIITDELAVQGYTYDQLLDIAYPRMKKENEGKLPLYKYLYLAQNPHTDIAADAATSFEALRTNTNRKQEKKTIVYHSALELWNKEKSDPKRACRLLAALPEEKCPANELEMILKEIFEMDKNALSRTGDWVVADIKRLIRFYDFVRWGKSKKDLAN